MRWQKVARMAIAAFVVAFAVVVVVALRRPGPPDVRPTTPRTDPQASVEIHGGTGAPATYSLTDKEGKEKLTLAFERQLAYPDGRNVLKNATLTLPDRNGRTITITGTDMEIIAPEEGSRDIKSAKMSEGVKLTTTDGLEVLSKEAAYDAGTGMLTVPGDVTFRRGRLSGSGVGATYDETRDVLWLLSRAKIVVAPDGQGGGAVDASAESAGLARAEHYIRLTKSAHLVSDGRTIDTDELVVQFTPDDRAIETMTLRGNSRITGTPGASGAEGMSARDIDLTYAADGRTLQQARLMENAVVQLGGGPDGGARRVSGRTVDLTLGADGSTVTALNAAQNVQVELPATADGPARRIDAAALHAGGPAGLQTATFSGGVTFRETRPARRGGPAARDRTGRSARLTIETQPGLGAIQQADFRGNVTIVDGETTVEGQRAVYRVPQDSFDVMPSPGDPGPPPSVNDGRLMVHARTITFTIDTRKLTADTDVRSSVQPANSKGQKIARDGGRMPSMLNQDEPVNMTSNRLQYDGAAGTGTYSGDARLFQGKTSIQGDTIVVDDRNANLKAHGNVRTLMFFEELDAKTKTKTLVQMTATGDVLVYEDAKRLATYTTGPTAKAHIVGTQGDVTADRIQLFLKPGANELDRAEADGNVTVKEGIRVGTGEHLTYTTADATYIMTGSPVVIIERNPECRETRAAKVTFQRNSDVMTVQNNRVAPVVFGQCTAK